MVLFAVCFLCVPTYVEVTSDNTKFLAFIAIAALAFVGAAPLVADKTDLAYKVHCVAAVVCFYGTFAYCLIKKYLLCQ